MSLKTKANCPICSSEKIVLYHDKVWSQPKGEVWRCESCSLVFLTDPIEGETQKVFYRDYEAHLIARKVMRERSPDELYKKMLSPAKERYRYVNEFIDRESRILEIGASVGSFLGVLLDTGFAIENLCAIESCEGHRKYINETLGIETFEKLDDIFHDTAFDLVQMFHVFEHITDPKSYLTRIRHYLTPKGRVLIEIPSGSDPLLSLYRSPEFRDYYFQPMHPYIYDSESITHVFESSGYVVERIVPYQRYGLDNHIGWIQTGRPGGDCQLRALFGDHLDRNYRNVLEKNQRTDTMFVFARPRDVV